MYAIIVLFTVLILCSGSVAETYTAELQNQSVRVLENSEDAPSCRLYRKRLEQFLQREDEVAHAHFKSGKKLSLRQIHSLIELRRRSQIPLLIGEEVVLWSLNFNLGAAGFSLNKQAVRMQMNSAYLNWEAESGFFPEHFQVLLSESGEQLSVTYKMSFLEACVGQVSFSISIKDDQGALIQAVSPQGQDLL